MATKKAGGSTKNGRDSNPQYLGIKRYGGEFVTGGSIIVRQRGTQYHPGDFVGIGRDDTLFAKISGVVQFSVKGPHQRRMVNIVPMEQFAAQD